MVAIARQMPQVTEFSLVDFKQRCNSPFEKPLKSALFNYGAATIGRGE